MRIKELITVIVVCFMLSGCAIHYHNEKSISGQGKDINTPYGKVNGVRAVFNSTVDVWIPYKPKG